MPVVGFISEKGGVGKTTVCYHIAVALSLYHKKSVLVIDADYQRGGITGRFFPELIEGFRKGNIPGETLYNKFQQLYSASDMDPSVTIRNAPYGVDVLISDKRLAGVSIDKMPSSNNIVENNKALLKHLQVIDLVIQGFKKKYDYILIDSHPEISDVLRSIIFAAHYCVSPVKLDLQSSIGVPTIISEIDAVNTDVKLLKDTIAKGLKHKPTKFAGAIGMMAREYGGGPKRTEQTELKRLQSAGAVFQHYVTEGDGLRRAAQKRIPVFNVSGANAAKQSQHFLDLTQEFMAKCP